MINAPVGPDVFAERWTGVLVSTGYVALDRTTLVGRVRALTDVVYAALAPSGNDPTGNDTADVDTESVAKVGTGLVELSLTGAATLAATVRLFGELLTGPGLPALQAALTSGFVTAQQERIFRDQEAIRRAALEARRGVEAALLASEARFRAMFTQAAIGIVITDAAGTLLEVNAAFATMFGYPEADLPGKTVADLRFADEPRAMREPFKQMAEGGRDHYRMERLLKKSDGTGLWVDQSVSLVRDETGSPRFMVGMIEDITERHSLEERLRHQANHDPLTGLGNRALFTERLNAAFTFGRDNRIGVCYLDLDGFKVINESLGHDVGDELLAAVAARLDALVTGPGRLVARMGGDEFVVLVERSSGRAELVGLAERVLTALTEPVSIGGHRLSVSASVGVVERSVVGTSPAETMRDADVTLYWAKADGKNRWADYDPDRNAREVARFTLSARMPAAVESEEFYVDYQPIVRLSDNELVGVEALVRWAHPEFGRLGPDQFIGLAEETGLIVPIGRWVLREAAGQARRWRDAYGPRAPRVSVNLAARQTEEPALVADVGTILAAADIPASAIQLELTESAIMETTGEPLATLHGLADLGVRIAIDDFGTGYSNLAYLRHLPVHAIKLDGSFMEGLRGVPAADPADSQIVTSLVSLAHVLGLEVIAEGVEEPQQAARLGAIGCDSAQGWLFAKPGPPEDIERWLA